MGGNPCEVGDIQRLLLYYKTERYAFSCNEPLVYTMVEASEFEPGRPSYIRAYHWKEKQIVPMSSAAPLPAGPAGPP
jgi:uncharacterized phage-associated protein